jgi:cytochrome c-type biogenesis protein
MLSGIGVEELRQGRTPRASLIHSALSFVVGFSVVFIAFGASASAVGHFLKQNRALLAPLAGALIVLFGLHLLGILAKIPVRAGLISGSILALAGLGLWAKLAHGGPVLLVIAKDGPVQLLALSLIAFFGPAMTRWLNRDVHLRNVGGQPGIASGFLMGFAFAFGWTPCIGPILTTVLALAAVSDTVCRGVFLLAMYSAGLALPFLITALGIGGFLRFYQRFRRRLHAVELACGVLLVFVGALVFFNRLASLSGKLSFLNRFVW